MCIAVIITNYSRECPLLIFHNREENVLRKTSPLQLNGNVLSPIDVKAGGVAAIGMNVKTGLMAVLTNVRYSSSLHAEGCSRGSLLREVLEEEEDGLAEKLATREVQGGFHLYLGNLFLEKFSENKITYYSYLGERGVESGGGASATTDLPTDSSSLPSILVRMNEHPSNESQWRKRDLVRDSISAALVSGLSIAELCGAVTSCMSNSDPLPIHNHNEDYSWSSLPVECEREVQRHILVPKISCGEDDYFATISQTLVYVDRTAREVHYQYRLVGGEQSKNFSSWDHRIIPY